MTGVGLYIAGMLSGFAAYVVGRTFLGLRDIHREALKGERGGNVVRLLGPYEAEANISLVEIDEVEVVGDMSGAHLHAV